MKRAGRTLISFLNMLSIEGLDEEDHSDTEPASSAGSCRRTGGSTERKRENRKIQDLPQKEQKVQLESVSEEIEAAEKAETTVCLPADGDPRSSKTRKNGNSSEVLKNDDQKFFRRIHCTVLAWRLMSPMSASHLQSPGTN